MGNRTSYLVDVMMRLNDQVSSGLGKIGGAAHHAESGLFGVKEAILGIGAAFTVERGIEKGKELFIDFNKEIQTLRISSAAMLQANGLAKTFDQATASAGGFVDEYLRFGQTAGVLTKDIFEVSNGIAVSVAQAGGGIHDITEVAERGAVAAKAYGVNLQYASLEISEAITRGAQVRQVFAKQLIATQHMSLEEFNKLSEKDRLGVIERALNSPAMKSAALAFGQSFDGVTTRLEDMIQILGGKIGLPLFKAITAEVESWNKWLTQNELSVEKFSHEFSDALMEGFRFVKDVVTFVVDNKEILLTLAKAYALSKMLPGGSILGGGRGGTAGGGAIGSLAGGALSGLIIGQMQPGIDEFQKGVHTVLGALGAIPGPIGVVANSFQLLAVGIEKLSDSIDEGRVIQQRNHERGAEVERLYKNFEAHGKTLDEATYRDTKRIIDQNRLADAGFNVDFARRGAFLGMTDLDDSGVKAAMGLFNAVLAHAKDTTQFGPELPTDFDPKAGKGKDRAGVTVNQHITVTNHVTSADPDRFAMDFSDALKRVAMNPRQARSAIRGI